MKSRKISKKTAKKTSVYNLGNPRNQFVMLTMTAAEKRIFKKYADGEPLGRVARQIVFAEVGIE